MIIENVDAFKAWLAKTLTPICDAEPVALAKYIVALVKKDKPEPELKAACLENLEVFLQSHTRSYVDKLFEALSSRVYLENGSRPGTPPVTAGSQQGAAAPEASAAITSTSTVATSTGTPVTASVLTTQRSLQRTSEDEISDDDRDHRRRQSPGTGVRTHSGDREKEDRRRNRPDNRAITRRGAMGPLPERYSRHDRRRGNPSRSPLGRARSRSPIRNNHLRDSALASIGRRENLGSNVMQPFGVNDTMSPVSLLGSVPTVSAMHNEWPKSLPTSFNVPPPPFLPKARCRDFDEKGFCLRGELCSFDHGSDPVVVDDISNMLRFPQGGKSQPTAIGLNIPLAVPVQLPVHQGMTAPAGHGPSAIPSLASGSGLGDASVGNRNLHRPPPLLANEPYNPEAPAIRGPGQSVGYWNGVQRTARSVPQSPPTAVQPYDPVYATPITRNVITIQRVPDVEPTSEQRPQNRNQHTGAITNFRQSSRRPGRGNYLGGYGNRFGARRPYYTQETPSNASLQVKNVPSMYNNIAKLNEHFTKFGKVLSIQTAFDGDPEGALVTFSKNSEAYAAYKSSEPMFNNRFIKLFWHRRTEGSTETKETKNPITTVASEPKETVESPTELHSSMKLMPARPSKETLDLRTTLRGRMREMAGLGPNPPPPPPSLRQEPKDVANHSEEHISAPAPQSAPALVPAPRPPRVFDPAAMRLDNTQDNLNVLMKKKEENNKEFVKKQVELQKQKQALLQKLLDQQKMLIAKAAGPEKDELMKAIRNFDQKIAELKKELASKPVKVEVSSKPALSKEQTTKELLDVELELYNRQSSGHDVSDLATKLAELRQRASVLGIDTSASGYHRTNAFVRGRGRGRPGGFTRSYSTEKPRKLLIIGFKQEEKDDVITHFNAFGALEDVFFNEAVPSLIVTYLHAVEAAAAASHGSDFNSKRLIMKWYRPSVSQELVNSPPLVKLPSSGSTDKVPNQKNSGSTVTLAGTGEDSLEAGHSGLHDDEADVDVDEELLLAGDDDDDDDNEKRSWR